MATFYTCGNCQHYYDTKHAMCCSEKGINATDKPCQSRKVGGNFAPINLTPRLEAIQKVIAEMRDFGEMGWINRFIQKRIKEISSEGVASFRISQRVNVSLRWEVKQGTIIAMTQNSVKVQFDNGSTMTVWPKNLTPVL